jgi:hypothetical protein
MKERSIQYAHFPTWVMDVMFGAAVRLVHFERSCAGAPKAAVAIRPAALACQRRSGRSRLRSPRSGRIWRRSSAACTTRRCGPKKPSRCGAMTSSSRRAAAARSSSPPPAHARAAPRPAPARRSSRGSSSTAPAAPSASSPSRPVLVRMLGQHLHAFRTAPDGQLFRGTRGGMLSESVYGRVWHAALGRPRPRPGRHRAGRPSL